MSKLFHCRCAVALKFANRDNDTISKIIAFDESHIEDVRVELAGFAKPAQLLNTGTNPSYAAGIYTTQDSTVSVTLNETVLDASWLALLDVAYAPVGGKAIDYVQSSAPLQSIYGIDTDKIAEVINGKAITVVSDPSFTTKEGVEAIKKAQGLGSVKSDLNVSTQEDLKKSLSDLISKYGKADDKGKKPIIESIAKVLTSAKKNNIEPETNPANPPSTSPPKQTQKNPPPKDTSGNYGTIILAMDHAPPGGYGAGGDGVERIGTDLIAEYLKKEIERKEPKIRVEIVKPEKYVSPEGRRIEKKPSTKLYGCEQSDLGDYQPYEDYIIGNYVNKPENKATIISVHLDAPPGRFGGSGAAVWNLNGATQVSEKLSNVILGTYINKFKTGPLQRKNTEIKRWNKCGNRSVRIFQNAPEGYALIEFGILRGITGDWTKEANNIPKNIEKFKAEQKQAFDALVDGLIQFKKGFGTSTLPSQTSSDPSTQNPNDQKPLDVKGFTQQPGLLVSFWYNVNNYIVKADYLFILTSAQINFGDGTPKISLSGNTVYSLVFNTWRMQESFSAGTPIDDVLKKVFASDATKTFSENSFEGKLNPKERLPQQEELSGLTYAEFISKLSRKFDLQIFNTPRTDQIGKIKIFREARGGSFAGSQVFWLGRGLFEKLEISATSGITEVNTVRDGGYPSQYASGSASGQESSPDSLFTTSDRVEFEKPAGQPSMLISVNGRQYIQSILPPPGWENIKAPGGGPGIQVVLKLPNGETWPKSSNLELHGLGENRGENAYDTVRSVAIWDPGSNTFKLKSGKIHTACDGGVLPKNGELIAYFKGVVTKSSPAYGTVQIKYNRFISLTVNGSRYECQLYHNSLHMTNRIQAGANVDIGTKIGNQGGIGPNGNVAYDLHMHEEFFINVPGKGRLYLDPFIVYNYSYSKDASGNRTFDSAARVTTAAVGNNNPGTGFASGSDKGTNDMIILRTEFRGIPRALQILPGATFLHFVTDYNRYLTTDDKNKYQVDPGIPIISQLQDWFIVRSEFNWRGDLTIALTAQRPKGARDKKIYDGQNWQSYRLNPGKGPALDDYYDYMRSIGDLSYRKIDQETGEAVSSFNSKLKYKDFLVGSQVGGNGNGNEPTQLTGKCTYIGKPTNEINQAQINNINTISAQLERAGLNKIAIAGVLGNIQQESRFGLVLYGKNSCRGGGTSNTATDSYGKQLNLTGDDCWGIVQWKGGRRDKAITKANKNGRDIAAQASFVVDELRSNEKICQCNNQCKEFGGNLIDLLNKATSAADAARIFRSCYERPGAEDSQERQKYADNIFRNLSCQP